MDSVDRRPVSEAVIESVAASEGVSQAELRPPLYSVVDPESLDDLCRSIDSNGRISFTYLGYDVTVSGDGCVDVRSER
jgi:hypothetical protein